MDAVIDLDGLLNSMPVVLGSMPSLPHADIVAELVQRMSAPTAISAAHTATMSASPSQQRLPQTAVLRPSNNYQAASSSSGVSAAAANSDMSGIAPVQTLQPDVARAATDKDNLNRQTQPLMQSLDDSNSLMNITDVESNGDASEQHVAAYAGARSPLEASAELDEQPRRHVSSNGAGPGTGPGGHTRTARGLSGDSPSGRANTHYLRSDSVPDPLGQAQHLQGALPQTRLAAAYGNDDQPVAQLSNSGTASARQRHQAPQPNHRSAASFSAAAAAAAPGWVIDPQWYRRGVQEEAIGWGGGLRRYRYDASAARAEGAAARAKSAARRSRSKGANQSAFAPPSDFLPPQQGHASGVDSGIPALATTEAPIPAPPPAPAAQPSSSASSAAVDWQGQDVAELRHRLRMLKSRFDDQLRKRTASSSKAERIERPSARHVVVVHSGVSNWKGDELNDVGQPGGRRSRSCSRSRSPMSVRSAPPSPERPSREVHAQPSSSPGAGAALSHLHNTPARLLSLAQRRPASASPTRAGESPLDHQAHSQPRGRRRSLSYLEHRLLSVYGRDGEAAIDDDDAGQEPRAPPAISMSVEVAHRWLSSPLFAQPPLPPSKVSGSSASALQCGNPRQAHTDPALLLERLTTDTPLFEAVATFATPPQASALRRWLSVADTRSIDGLGAACAALEAVASSESAHAVRAQTLAAIKVLQASHVGDLVSQHLQPLLDRRWALRDEERTQSILASNGLAVLHDINVPRGRRPEGRLGDVSNRSGSQPPAGSKSVHQKGIVLADNAKSAMTMRRVVSSGEGSAYRLSIIRDLLSKLQLKIPFHFLLVNLLSARHLQQLLQQRERMLALHQSRLFLARLGYLRALAAVKASAARATFVLGRQKWVSSCIRTWHSTTALTVREEARQSITSHLADSRVAERSFRALHAAALAKKARISYAEAVSRWSRSKRVAEAFEGWKLHSRKMKIIRERLEVMLQQARSGLSSTVTSARSDDGHGTILADRHGSLAALAVDRPLSDVLRNMRRPSVLGDLPRHIVAEQQVRQVQAVLQADVTISSSTMRRVLGVGRLDLAAVASEGTQPPSTPDRGIAASARRYALLTRKRLGLLNLVHDGIDNARRLMTVAASQLSVHRVTRSGASAALVRSVALAIKDNLKPPGPGATSSAARSRVSALIPAAMRSQRVVDAVGARLRGVATEVHDRLQRHPRKHLFPTGDSRMIGDAATSPSFGNSNGDTADASAGPTDIDSGLADTLRQVHPLHLLDQVQVAEAMQYAAAAAIESAASGSRHGDDVPDLAASRGSTTSTYVASDQRERASIAFAAPAVSISGKLKPLWSQLPLELFGLPSAEPNDGAGSLPHRDGASSTLRPFDLATSTLLRGAQALISSDTRAPWMAHLPPHQQHEQPLQDGAPITKRRSRSHTHKPSGAAGRAHATSSYRGRASSASPPLSATALLRKQASSQHPGSSSASSSAAASSDVDGASRHSPTNDLVAAAAALPLPASRAHSRSSSQAPSESMRHPPHADSRRGSLASLLDDDGRPATSSSSDGRNENDDRSSSGNKSTDDDDSDDDTGGGGQGAAQVLLQPSSQTASSSSLAFVHGHTSIAAMATTVRAVRSLRSSFAMWRRIGRAMALDRKLKLLWRARRIGAAFASWRVWQQQRQAQLAAAEALGARMVARRAMLGWNRHVMAVNAARNSTIHGFHDRMLQRRLFNLLRRNVAIAALERNQHHRAVAHHDRHLLMTSFRRWRRRTDDNGPSRDFTHRIVMTNGLRLATSALRLWRYRTARRQLLRRVFGTAVTAWRHRIDDEENVHAHNFELLSTVLSGWRTAARAAAEERREAAAGYTADAFARHRLMIKCLVAWRDWIAQQRAVRAFKKRMDAKKLRAAWREWVKLHLLRKQALLKLYFRWEIQAKQKDALVSWRRAVAARKLARRVALRRILLAWRSGVFNDRRAAAVVMGDHHNRTRYLRAWRAATERLRYVRDAINFYSEERDRKRIRKAIAALSRHAVHRRVQRRLREVEAEAVAGAGIANAGAGSSGGAASRRGSAGYAAVLSELDLSIGMIEPPLPRMRTVLLSPVVNIPPQTLAHGNVAAGGTDGNGGAGGGIRGPTRIMAAAVNPPAFPEHLSSQHGAFVPVSAFQVVRPSSAPAITFSSVARDAQSGPGEQHLFSPMTQAPATDALPAAMDSDHQHRSRPASAVSAVTPLPMFPDGHHHYSDGKSYVQSQHSHSGVMSGYLDGGMKFTAGGSPDSLASAGTGTGRASPLVEGAAIAFHEAAQQLLKIDKGTGPSRAPTPAAPSLPQAVGGQLAELLSRPQTRAREDGATSAASATTTAASVGAINLATTTVTPTSVARPPPHPGNLSSGSGRRGSRDSLKSSHNNNSCSGIRDSRVIIAGVDNSERSPNGTFASSSSSESSSLSVRSRPETLDSVSSLHALGGRRLLDFRGSTPYSSQQQATAQAHLAAAQLHAPHPRLVINGVDEAAAGAIKPRALRASSVVLPTDIVEAATALRPYPVQASPASSTISIGTVHSAGILTRSLDLQRGVSGGGSGGTAGKSGMAGAGRHTPVEHVDKPRTPRRPSSSIRSRAPGAADGSGSHIGETNSHGRDAASPAPGPSASSASSIAAPASSSSSWSRFSGGAHSIARDSVASLGSSAADGAEMHRMRERHGVRAVVSGGRVTPLDPQQLAQTVGDDGGGATRRLRLTADSDAGVIDAIHADDNLGDDAGSAAGGQVRVVYVDAGDSSVDSLGRGTALHQDSGVAGSDASNITERAISLLNATNLGLSRFTPINTSTSNSNAATPAGRFDASAASSGVGSHAKSLAGSVHVPGTPATPDSLISTAESLAQVHQHFVGGRHTPITGLVSSSRPGSRASTGTAVVGAVAGSGSQRRSRSISSSSRPPSRVAAAASSGVPIPAASASSGASVGAVNSPVAPDVVGASNASSSASKSVRSTAAAGVRRSPASASVAGDSVDSGASTARSRRHYAGASPSPSSTMLDVNNNSGSPGIGIISADSIARGSSVMLQSGFNGSGVSDAREDDSLEGLFSVNSVVAPVRPVAHPAVNDVEPRQPEPERHHAAQSASGSRHAPGTSAPSPPAPLPRRDSLSAVIDTHLERALNTNSSSSSSDTGSGKASSCSDDSVKNTATLSARAAALRSRAQAVTRKGAVVGAVAVRNRSRHRQAALGGTAAANSGSSRATSRGIKAAPSRPKSRPAVSRSRDRTAADRRPAAAAAPGIVVDHHGTMDGTSTVNRSPPLSPPAAAQAAVAAASPDADDTFALSRTRLDDRAAASTPASSSSTAPSTASKAQDEHVLDSRSCPASQVLASLRHELRGSADSGGGGAERSITGESNLAASAATSPSSSSSSQSDSISSSSTGTHGYQQQPSSTPRAQHRHSFGDDHDSNVNQTMGAPATDVKQQLQLHVEQLESSIGDATAHERHGTHGNGPAGADVGAYGDVENAEDVVNRGDGNGLRSQHERGRPTARITIARFTDASIQSPTEQEWLLSASMIHAVADHSTDADADGGAAQLPAIPRTGEGDGTSLRQLNGYAASPDSFLARHPAFSLESKQHHQLEQQQQPFHDHQDENTSSPQSESHYSRNATQTSALELASLLNRANKSEMDDIATAPLIAPAEPQKPTGAMAASASAAAAVAPHRVRPDVHATAIVVPSTRVNRGAAAAGPGPGTIVPSRSRSGTVGRGAAPALSDKFLDRSAAVLGAPSQASRGRSPRASGSGGGPRRVPILAAEAGAAAASTTAISSGFAAGLSAGRRNARGSAGVPAQSTSLERVTARSALERDGRQPHIESNLSHLSAIRSEGEEFEAEEAGGVLDRVLDGSIGAEQRRRAAAEGWKARVDDTSATGAASIDSSVSTSSVWSGLPSDYGRHYPEARLVPGQVPPIAVPQDLKDGELQGVPSGFTAVLTTTSALPLPRKIKKTWGIDLAEPVVLVVPDAPAAAHQTAGEDGAGGSSRSGAPPPSTLSMSETSAALIADVRALMSSSAATGR